MSDWNIGADHDSHEVVTLKQRLASKDNAYGTAQSQLLKKAQELEEMRTTLDENIQKLRLEADKALHYERESVRYSESLRNEQVQRQNAELSLAAARDQIRSQQQETLELQNIIHSLSTNVESSKSTNSTIEQETKKLRSRIQELEADLLRAVQATAAPRVPRPSPVFQSPTAVAQRQLADLQEAMKVQEAELEVARDQVRSLQANVAQAENEKTAIERRLRKDLEELRSTLEDKDDELEFFRGQGGDDARAREEELLRRVEEEEAKVEALNLLLCQSEGGRRKIQNAEEALRDCERRLTVEKRRVADMEATQVELIREKEEALDELAVALRASEELKDKVDNLLLDNQDLPAQTGSLLAKLSAPCPEPQSSRSTDQVGPETLERLLCAIDRLRSERNDAQRSVEFLTLESRCAQEGLEKQQKLVSERDSIIVQLEATLAQSLASPVDSHVASPYSRRCDLAARAFAVVINQLRVQTDQANARLVCQSAILGSTRQQLQEANEACRTKDSQLQSHLSAHTNELRTIQDQCDILKSHITQLKYEAEERQQAHEETHQTLLEAQAQLADAMQSVNAVEQQRVSLNLQVYDLSSAYRESQDALENAQSQLADYVKALEDMESQRDSLNTQVTNLEMDLEGAKEELAEAEERYSLMQTQQLATMSTNEVTRTLKSKIELLEGRVGRRTEQIGIHQHDIKRLETNLRLQEERVAEMTVELETMAVEKEAMVEDCAAAREARDDALQKLENLEMELETWEGKLEAMEQKAALAETQQHMELASLVGVVTGVMTRARVFAYNNRISLAASSQEVDRLSEALRTAKENTTTLSMTVSSLEVQRDEAVRSVQQANTQLEELQTAAAKDAESQRELNDALKALYSQHAEKAHRLSNRLKVEESLQAQNLVLQEDLKMQTDTLSGVRDELKTMASLHAEAQQVQDVLRARETNLVEQLSALQGELAAVEAVRKAAVTHYADSKADLEYNLARANEHEQTIQSLEKDLADLRLQHEQQLQALREQLSRLQDELHEVKQVNITLGADHQQAADEWVHAKEELEARLAQLGSKAELCESVQQQLADLQAQHSKSLAGLQRQLEGAVEDAHAATEARKQIELARQQAADELRRQREDSAEELISLRSALTAEQQARSQAESRSAGHQELQQRCEAAEAIQSRLQDDLTVVEQRLDQAIEDLDLARREKEEKRSQLIELQAELQRAESLCHELEAKARQSEQQLNTLYGERDVALSQLRDAQLAVQTLEARISAQTVDHARALEGLQEGVVSTAPSSTPGEAMAELQEQYDDLMKRCDFMTEEQMQTDEQLIALKKEKRLLESKIASLTRKTQKLQTKLDVALSATAPSSSLPTAAGKPTRTTTSASSASVPKSHARLGEEGTVAGPSSGARQRTPETTPSRSAHPRTPEPPTPAVPTIGVKRRVPDDFEDSDGLPAQAFTADSLPSAPVAHTSRMRTHGHSLRSGFTPVRHHLPTSTTTQATSPVRRPAPSSATISDVTNSPRGHSGTRTDGAKRGGWLGKVRSGQAVGPRGGYKRLQVDDSS